MTRGKTGRTSHERLIKKLGCDVLIFDEAHNAKRIKGSDTERVFRISQCRSIRKGHLVLLSGTPIPNTLEDLAAQIRILYKGRAKIPGLDLDHLPTLAKQIERSHPLLVRNVLVRRMLRRMTETCLPVGHGFTREGVPVTLNPVEQAQYDSAVDDPFATATEKIYELRRICLHSESKYATLKEAVSRALNRRKYRGSGRPPRVVIAESSYACGVTRDFEDQRPAQDPGSETYMATRLANDFRGKLSVFVLDGKNSRRRDKIIAEFESCPTPAALLTLVPVAGEGINLTCAADGILISPTFTVSSEDQYLRRMLRFGQTLDVHLQVLACKGTIEQGMQEYAVRKERVVRGLIDGRPLTPLEREILTSDSSHIRRGGVVAYETMSPRQQARWILSRIQGKGKAYIAKFLNADDGKYARDFARGYPMDEETSYSGNTARLVTSVVNSPSKGRRVQVADIACGCRTLERIYEGSERIAVSSVDINQAALTAGGELLKSPKKTLSKEVSCMDELPFPDASQDVAVLSLALDCTKHSNRRGTAGEERIRTFKELSRVLKAGGSAVLTFQEGLFPDEAAFMDFADAVELASFGFRVDRQMTGLGSAADREQGKPFRVWVLTLEKTGDANPVLSDELWRRLRFPGLSRPAGEKRRPSHVEPPEEKTGTYHDTFTIGSSTLSYRPTTQHQKEADAAHKKLEHEELQLRRKIEKLLATYGSADAIPDHLLLSITPEKVSRASQMERDLYFDLLIERYGSIEKIPVEEISARSSVIIVRGHNRRGPYLCLARLDTAQRSCGFGKRYFYDSEQGNGH